MTLKPTFDFLSQLAKNNNREWFNGHKEDYSLAHEQIKSFVADLADLMLVHDEIDPAASKVFRIYKDIRFSKDKTPYKTGWSASLKRKGAQLRGGYYVQLEPGKTFLAGGFFGPNPKDLLHIRKQLEQDATPMRNVLTDPSFQSYFGSMLGEQVKSSPKGFSKEAENIDLIRYKQFYFRHDFSDRDALSSDFARKVSDGFSKIRPFFDVMSEMLTTDLNGISML